MSPFAHVQSVQALDDLKAALSRFRAGAGDALQAAEQEIRRTLDWLQERLNYWLGEVRRRQEMVSQAAAALARCQASGYYDRDGRYYRPNCTAYEQALQQAQRRLQEAEAELRNVQHWTRQVEQARVEYSRRAQRLMHQLADELPMADAFLERKIGILTVYLLTLAPAMAGLASLGARAVAPASPGAAQGLFRDTMAGLSRAEKGAWGEYAVRDEVSRLKHRTLLEHGGSATAPGYDSVSWDGRTLHIWEAKNRSATDSGEAAVHGELGALDAEKRRANAAQFLRDLAPDDPERPAIVDAIQQDRVQWHIRLGPDTDISFAALDRLEWGNVEARQYSYDDMLRTTVSTPGEER